MFSLNRGSGARKTENKNSRKLEFSTSLRIGVSSVTVFAEAHEGRVRVLQLRLT